MASSSKESLLLALPNEIKVKIINYLEAKDVASFSLSNKDLHGLSIKDLTLHQRWGNIGIWEGCKVLLNEDMPKAVASSLYVCRNCAHLPILQRFFCHTPNGFYVRSLCVRDISQEDADIVTETLSSLPLLRKLHLIDIVDHEDLDSDYILEFHFFFRRAEIEGISITQIFPHLVEVRIEQARTERDKQCINLLDVLSVFATVPTLRLLHGVGVTSESLWTADHDEQILHNWTDVPEGSSNVEDLAMYMALGHGDHMGFDFLVSFRGLKRVLLDLGDVYARLPHDFELVDALIKSHRASLEYLQLTCLDYTNMLGGSSRSTQTLKGFPGLKSITLEVSFYWWWVCQSKCPCDRNRGAAFHEDLPLDQVFPPSVQKITIRGQIDVRAMNRVISGVRQSTLQGLQKLRYLRFTDAYLLVEDPTVMVEDYIQRCHDVGVKLFIDQWVQTSSGYEWRG